MNMITLFMLPGEVEPVTASFVIRGNSSSGIMLEDTLLVVFISVCTALLSEGRVS